MIDEADSSVVLAELQVALFRECNNQRLSPWGRPFSCSPGPITRIILDDSNFGIATVYCSLFMNVVAIPRQACQNILFTLLL